MQNMGSCQRTTLLLHLYYAFFYRSIIRKPRNYTAIKVLFLFKPILQKILLFMVSKLYN